MFQTIFFSINTISCHFSSTCVFLNVLKGIQWARAIGRGRQGTVTCQLERLWKIFFRWRRVSWCYNFHFVMYSCSGEFLINKINSKHYSCKTVPKWEMPRWNNIRNNARTLDNWIACRTFAMNNYKRIWSYIVAKYPFIKYSNFRCLMYWLIGIFMSGQSIKCQIQLSKLLEYTTLILQ